MLRAGPRLRTGRVAGARRPRTPAVPTAARSAARGRTSRTCTCRPSGCRWRSPSCTTRSRSAVPYTCRSPPTSSRSRAATRSPGVTSRLHHGAVPRRRRGRGLRGPVEPRRRRGVDRRRGDACPTCSPTPSDPSMRLLVVGLNPSLLSADDGHRVRPPGQPVLAGRARVGLVTACARPVPRAARRRHRHDQSRAPGTSRRRRAARATSTAPEPRAWSASWRGSGRMRCASSASPATAPRSTEGATRLAAASLRRTPGVRDAEHERTQRARQARRPRRPPSRLVQRRDRYAAVATSSSRRLLLERSSASWNDAANDATPSRSSVAVTSSKSTPASARPAMAAARVVDVPRAPCRRAGPVAGPAARRSTPARAC